MKNFSYLFLCIFLLSIGCGSEPKKNDAQNDNQVSMAIPVMSYEQVKEIIENTEQIEMFFHEYGFSSTVPYPQAPVRLGSIIDISEPPGNVDHCRETILISVLDKNYSLMTTLRIFFSEGCAFIDFYMDDDKEPRYRNDLSLEGQRLFQDIINEAKRVQNQ